MGKERNLKNVASQKGVGNEDLREWGRGQCL